MISKIPFLNINPVELTLLQKNLQSINRTSLIVRPSSEVISGVRNWNTEIQMNILPKIGEQAAEMIMHPAVFQTYMVQSLLGTGKRL